MREMRPKFVKSLDYSLTMDYNQWCLSEETVIKNKVTGQTITVPTDTLPVIPDFSLVTTMNPGDFAPEMPTKGHMKSPTRR